MENRFNVGEAVTITTGAIYLNNEKKVPDNLIGVRVYIREVKDNSCLVGRAKTGPLLGEISNEDLTSMETYNTRIEPYIVQIPSANFPLYFNANKNSGVVKRLNKFALMTIVDEKDGYGKVKVGSGWLELEKVNKLT